jgi:hypothetical protein
MLVVMPPTRRSVRQGLGQPLSRRVRDGDRGGLFEFHVPRHAFPDGRKATADFTPTQGRYLAFIRAYTNLHGYPPAESEVAAAMCVSPPSVNQMVKTLEKKGLIERQPGQARSGQVLVPDGEVPPWNNRKPVTSQSRRSATSSRTSAAPASLYIFKVYLLAGPIAKKFAKREISRVNEIRGDQTLERLHHAIFKAYDRWEEHLYEFQFGKRPFDPDGVVYGSRSSQPAEKGYGNASTTKLDDLDLKPQRVFGYWFDFGDDWFHQVQLERIELAIPTVTYPRVTKRVGQSPPQCRDE